jgi:ribose 5-phosphate isomerase A
MAKQKASFACVDEQIRNGLVIGIGSGSTVVFAVERLGMLVKDGKISVKAWFV